jgi:hypothetical protein
MTHLMIVQRQMPSVPAPRSNFARVLAIAVCFAYVQIRRKFQQFLDRSTVHVAPRWLGFARRQCPMLRTHNQVG